MSAFVDDFAFPQTVEQLETTAFGNTSKTFIAGLADGQVIPMSGPADVAMGTFVALLKGAQIVGSLTATVSWAPGGSVAGQIKQDAEVYVSAYETRTSASGRAEYSASLQITGVVTNGTW